MDCIGADDAHSISRMRAIDQLNAHFGRGTVGFGTAGEWHGWKLRREFSLRITISKPISTPTCMRPKCSERRGLPVPLRRLARRRADGAAEASRRCLADDPPARREAGIDADMCCHTFRATGLANFLANGGTLENAQAMADHASPRTKQLYDRTDDEITLDEVERIAI
jgi:hypothetical protein